MKASAYEQRARADERRHDPHLGACRTALLGDGRPRHRRDVRAHGRGGRPPAGTGERFTLAADMVFVRDRPGADAVRPRRRGHAGALRRPHRRRRASGAPASPGVWAGGDCVAGGQDLTVTAVEDGKQAAISIDRHLTGALAARGRVRGNHGGSAHRLPRHQVAQPVLARLRAADRPRGERHPRLPGGLGRGGLEDARRRGRPSSTSTARATGRSTGRTGACSASTTSS